MGRLGFRWEPVQTLLEAGLVKLTEAHWREVNVNGDKIPLAPDWKKFKQLERNGVAKWLSARTVRTDKLVGYSAWIIGPSLHYRYNVFALNDAIYLDPAYRQGWNGVRLIDEAELALRALGVSKIVYHTKHHVLIGARAQPLARLLEARGYKNEESNHGKIIR